MIQFFLRKPRITNKDYKLIFNVINDKLFNMYANEAPYSDTDFANEFKENIDKYLKLINIDKSIDTQEDVDKMVQAFRKWIQKNWPKLF